MRLVDQRNDRCSSSRPVEFSHGQERIRQLSRLACRLNRAFSRAQNLDDILHAILVGATAGEGLGFNRAFLVLYDHDEQALVGRYGIGPSDSREASRIWQEITDRDMDILQILEEVRVHLSDRDHPLNRLARMIRVPISAKSHVLVRSLVEQRTILFSIAGNGSSGDAMGLDDLIGAREFATAPIISDDKAVGLVLADNFVTGAPIVEEDLEALHLLAGFASIAVGKALVCEALEERIQELCSLNDQIERNKDLLVQAERYAAIGRMADQLLHEIRNPVSSIGGVARLLKKKLEDPKLRTYVDTIVQQSQRLEHTLGAVFDFAHDPELNPEPVRFYQLIHTSISLLNGDLKRHGIRLHLQLPEDEPVLSLDRIHVQQALLNILKNAVEAMPEGGLLILSVSIKDEALEIQVADTGLGMARGHFVRAAEPFFTTKIQAIGLGLSLAKRIFELHGGNLSINRNKFGGTNVILNLPLDGCDHSGHESAC